MPLPGGYSAMATGVMVAYCGWDPTTPLTNTTTLLDGNGTKRLWLPSLYVTGVSSVTITNDDGSTYDAIMGAGNDVTWGVDGELLWEGYQYFGLVDPSQRFLYWPHGEQNVAVVWSGGYSSVPNDLDAVLTQLSNRLPTVTGATQRHLGQASVSYAQQIACGGLLWTEQIILNKYKIMRLG